MSKIKLPDTLELGPAKNVSEFLAAVNCWYSAKKIHQADRSFTTVWYRGMGETRHDACQPGVYREEFTERAKRHHICPGSMEDERKMLEADIHNNFRFIRVKRISLDGLLGFSV